MDTVSAAVSLTGGTVGRDAGAEAAPDDTLGPFAVDPAPDGARAEAVRTGAGGWVTGWTEHAANNEIWTAHRHFNGQRWGML